MTEPQTSGGWRPAAKGCGCLALVFIFLSFLLLKACQWSDAHPTDAVMVREFNENRTTFLALLKMVEEERRVTRIGDGFIWIDGAENVDDADRPRYLSNARLARYESLFKKLNLESGVVRREDGSVGFLRSSSGMVTSGSGKEFIWSRNLKAPVMSVSDPRSLEEACKPGAECSTIRRIAPDWYISFESH